VRKRVGDKRVLALAKAFLKAGILLEDGTLSDTDAGTPQGSILPKLAVVRVLFRIYAKCLDRGTERNRMLVQEALGYDPPAKRWRARGVDGRTCTAPAARPCSTRRARGVIALDYRGHHRDDSSAYRPGICGY
jgi:hypothetical protein